MEGELPPALVLYDGNCGLCDRWVQWLLRHDREGAIHFAALDSPLGRSIIARHPELPTGIDSILLLEQLPQHSDSKDERLSWRSRAIFRIFALLPEPWRSLSLLRWFPPFLSDLGYRLVAKIRYFIWGTIDACRVPSQAERARFLS